MKQIIVIKTGVLISILFFGYAVLLLPVSANGDGHADSEETVSISADAAEMKRLETLLSTLKQLVALLTELRKIQPATTWTMPMMTTPSVPATPATHDDAEKEHGGDDHAETSTEPVETPAVPKLLIEIEEHSGKTHAHVRFIDGRPEAMFFVNVPITDEDGIVSGVSAQTGLGMDEVRNALKYMGMNN